MSDKDYWYIVDIQGDISNEVDYDFINFDGNEPLLIDENKSEVLKHCIKKAFPDRNFDVSHYIIRAVGNGRNRGGRNIS